MATECLIIVGTGIRCVGQMTTECMAWIRRAEKIFHAIDDPLGVQILRALNPNAPQTSLLSLYSTGEQRKKAYSKMIETMMESVRAGYITVGVFYGHPGVMAFPPHEAIRQARAEGFMARMLPGISAEDCLYADLGVDAGEHGCLTVEATDFLLRERQIDPTSSLILWQVGVLGNTTFRQEQYQLPALPLLIEKLLRWYPHDHQVTVYEAALVFDCEPQIQTLQLDKLYDASLSWRSTLYVPPCRKARYDKAVYQRMKALGLLESRR